MPKKNNVVYCINHSNEELVREINRFSLISIAVDQKGEKLHNLQSGLPISVFRCLKCHYTEIYYDNSPLENPTIITK